MKNIACCLLSILFASLSPCFLFFFGGLQAASNKVVSKLHTQTMQISKFLPKHHLLQVLLLLLTTTCVSATFLHPARLGFPDRSYYPSRSTKGVQRLTKNLSTHYYTQIVDHFNYNPESYTTFQQRYLLSSDYWGGANSSSPIFAYMGAEESIDGEASFVGFFEELASRFNALLVYMEHRYYGTSIPFVPDLLSQNTSTLGYFSSTQALADYAKLIIDLKKNLSAESCPVIVVGGSYGGMLASWFRLKYPHLAIGAYASSAPILYFDDLTPHDGYDLIVSNDYKAASESCHNSIRNSWFEMDDLAAKPNGLLNISQMFNACDTLNATNGLKKSLEYQFSARAQYDTPWTHLVGKICTRIDELPEGTSDLVRVATTFKGKECWQISDYYQSNKNDGWLWQRCTEMVMPKGRGPNDTMYQAAPFDMDNYTKWCQQLYGVTPRPHWITTEFGGHNIKSVLAKFASNIIFTNGLRDPYSVGGVLFNISDSVVAVYTEKGSHCMDMYPSSPHEPDWLVAQRKTVIDITIGWLADYRKQS